MRRLCPAIALALVLASPACTQPPDEPTWYPPSEPSPFIPDAATRIGGPEGNHTVFFRTTWGIEGAVKRAVLCLSPQQTARVYLDGRIACEGQDSHQGAPVFVDVTDRLKPGAVFVAAKVASDWRPALYLQMRVEYGDGQVDDLVSSGIWEACSGPGEDWLSNPRAEGDWGPARALSGYRGEGKAFWQHAFALLPREQLQARMAAHNDALQALWEADRRVPGLQITQAPEDPRWAAQFADMCRIDEATGQLIDGAGQVRHLFFTIYGQKGLGLLGWDFDRYERDLDLMAAADVNLYIRFLGWGDLLTAQGEWALLQEQPAGSNLPHFDRAVDVLDHFVRRAYAHGRYIAFEGDFFWSAHPEVVLPPYRSRYHLYPEVAKAQALAMRRIMHRYSECENVLGMMIGEEDIVLEHDLDNPHQRQLFAEFLTRKYGTVEAFREQTPRGYDYADRSGYRRRDLKPELWPDADEETVLVPGFEPDEHPFAKVESLEDLPLPLWPRFLSPEDRSIELPSFKSYNQFTPEDPLWIDFYEMREDELLFGMLSRFAAIVRQGMPRQLLFYSNAQDFTNSWHFLHLYRRADLPFDAIGVGCHDSGQNLSQLPAWATVRKAIKVVSSYRPYALSPGSPAAGIASGEGEGGSAEQPEEVLNYYRGALFDEIGGGVAWTQTYTWNHMSGAHGDTLPHETPLLRWMGQFLPAVQGVEFSLRRPVQVLLVRNTNLAHSNMSGLDYGNAMAVAEALTQLNVEFDIVMDRDLCYGPEDLKIDLSPYRLVILPSVTLDSPGHVWEALDRWLCDPESAGGRVLALGRIGKRGPRLQPLTAFPEPLGTWLGMEDYEAQVSLQGPQELVLTCETGEERLTVDFGKIPPTGTFGDEGALLRTAAGEAIGRVSEHAGNAIHAFGFPLGLAHEPLWGMSPEQEPRDALVPIYETLLQAAGVQRPVLAPHNLRVYPATDGRMILIRERAGIATDAEVAVKLPGRSDFAGLEQTRTEDGYTRFRVELKPWEGKWWKAE
jgi:hypothetical protein